MQLIFITHIQVLKGFYNYESLLKDSLQFIIKSNMTKNIKINAIRYNGEILDIDNLEINYNIFDETYVGTIDKYIKDFINVSNGNVVYKSQLDKMPCPMFNPHSTNWPCRVTRNTPEDGISCKFNCVWWNEYKRK